MTAPDYILMRRNTTNEELQDFLLELLEELPNFDLKEIAERLNDSNDFHRKMLNVIREKVFSIYEDYGHKRCGDKNIVIDRSKFDDEWEYYRVRVHIYEIEVPSEEAMDCIFRNIALNIASLNCEEINHYFSNHVDTAKFDTRFVRGYANVLLKDQDLRDEYFFYLYWDKTVTSRYIKSDGYQKLFAQQDIDPMDRFYQAWELYKQTVIELFPPRYCKHLLSGTPKQEIIDPDLETFDVNEFIKEVPVFSDFIKDFYLTETK